ncbi:cysteine desulfurase [Candidatus Woesearchaeota archaeon]|nr:cysteine desulfurase [Candidatus Woesearchaeota archaeon]
MKVYLDNAATTKTASEVAELVSKISLEDYANPSSIHSQGENAKKIIDDSRKKIADSIGAQANEIIFTASGSESNNLALRGLALANPQKKHIITTKIEHPSVLNTCSELEQQDYTINYLDVDNQGFVDLEQLQKSIREDTLVVSIIHANNEIGTIQNLQQIGQVCKEKNVLFHTDAVQSYTKTPINVAEQNISLAAFSAHKLHGPKGIGALYVKNGVQLKPIITGGAQEKGLRAATHNTPSIAGFAKAIEITTIDDIKKMVELRDYLISELLKIDNTYINGAIGNDRLCNNVNARFDFIEGEAILLYLDQEGIYVSTGSACSSKKLEPSKTLLALGLKPEESHGSIRISLSNYTTKEEIDYTIEKIKTTVETLRKMSPFKGGTNNVQ